MHTTVDWQIRPEERELERKQTELAGLEVQLAERELELETYRAELDAFERQYQSIVGVRYAELDEIEALLAEAKARLNSHPPAEDGQAQPRGSFRSSAGAGSQAGHMPQAFAASESLKKLWREAGKHIHPDLSVDPAERARRNQTMAEVNAAYANGDEARLLAILRDWEARPESIVGEGTALELVRIIRRIAQIEERLQTLASSLASLKGSEMSQMRARCEAAEGEGRDPLEEMAAYIEARIEDAQRQWAALQAFIAAR